jgi:hypothetical protein
MNRRSFLAALGVAPIAAAGATVAAPRAFVTGGLASLNGYSIGERGPEAIIPTTNGEYVPTGLFMEIKADEPRILFRADRFAINGSEITFTS